MCSHLTGRIRDPATTIKSSKPYETNTLMHKQAQPFTRNVLSKNKLIYVSDWRTLETEHKVLMLRKMHSVQLEERKKAKNQLLSKLGQEPSESPQTNSNPPVNKNPPRSSSNSNSSSSSRQYQTTQQSTDSWKPSTAADKSTSSTDKSPTAANISSSNSSSSPRTSSSSSSSTRTSPERSNTFEPSSSGLETARQEGSKSSSTSQTATPTRKSSRPSGPRLAPGAGTYDRVTTPKPSTSYDEKARLYLESSI